MTTKITEQNISNLANAGIQWQSVITADGSTATTAVAGRGYFIDTTSNAHTINLPASAIAGDTIVIKDYAGTFATNNLTIARNGNNIQGVANDSEISTNRANVELVYIDSTKGWLYTNESNVADLGAPSFISATGGTVTTSGNDRIHTFTGDGCFVVSSVSIFSSYNKVGYLVVAGGGGAAGDNGGGGGAGGYREGRCGPVTPYTDSPLSTSGLTVTAQTYPITVGGGGAAGGPSNQGGSGSNSVFSTITSAGGGGSGGDDNTDALDGGSGGGGGGRYGPVNPTGGAGLGNTPPVSPPQGNDGGAGGAPGNSGAGGGGGAGATGGPGQAAGTCNGGPGGNGVASSITGSSVTRAGGGGGGTGQGACGTAGTGGSGGGGAGSVNSATATNGTANTGGGAGGGGQAGTGGSGGKGIVIIRYKFQ